MPLVTDASEQVLDQYRAKTLVLSRGERGQSRVDENSRDPLTVLMVATALVLLIASVNVANLLLARGSTRVGEISVRASLGATRSRLLTLLLIEVALLAAGGALLSLPLTLAALQGIRLLLPAFAAPAFEFGADVTVVAVTFGLAALSTLVFGLIPALKLMRAEASPALQTQSARQTGARAGLWGRQRLN